MASFIAFPSAVKTYLAQLQPDTQPVWGLMTAQHVVEHLLLVLNVSIAKFKIPIEVVTPAEKLPKYKASLMGDFPFPHDFKAPFLPKEDLLPLRYADLEAAKDALYQGIDNFFAYYEANPNITNPHPIFGDCHFEEWQRFHAKHFTHHFEQFGLL